MCSTHCVLLDKCNQHKTTVKENDQTWKKIDKLTYKRGAKAKVQMNGRGELNTQRNTTGRGNEKNM